MLVELFKGDLGSFNLGAYVFCLFSFQPGLKRIGELLGELGGNFGGSLFDNGFVSFLDTSDCGESEFISAVPFLEPSTLAYGRFTDAIGNGKG